MSLAPKTGASKTSGQPYRLVAKDGVTLEARIWAPAHSKGTLVILTGRTEYTQKYSAFATQMTTEGWAVTAMDWRGQGLSQRLLPDPRRGHVESFADYQLDMAAYLALLQQQSLPKPWIMVAHSMGGCIGLRTLLDPHPFKGVIFSAPMWGIVIPTGSPPGVQRILAAAVRMGLGRRYVPAPALQDISIIQSDLFQDNPLTSDRQTWDWLRSHLTENPDLALAGPTIRWTILALQECEKLAQAPCPKLPCLTLLGGQESIVSPAFIQQRMARWPQGQLLTLPQARHEVLMEAAPLRAQALQAIRTFSDQILTA